LWRVAQANSVAPRYLLTEAGVRLRSLKGGDLDVDPGEQLIEALSRLTNLDEGRLRAMTLPAYLDPVRPRRRTAFCPQCWALAIAAGRPRFFTSDGVRASSFLCLAHNLPLVSGPRALWLRSPDPIIYNVLRVITLELRSFNRAAGARLGAAEPDQERVGQAYAADLQAAVHRMLFPGNRMRDVTTALLRIALTPGRLFNDNWFRQLDMPNTSPAPVSSLYGLLDQPVEIRCAVIFRALTPILSGQGLAELSAQEKFIAFDHTSKSKRVREDRNDLLAGNGRFYDPHINPATTLLDLLKAYDRAIRTKPPCPTPSASVAST
jgi:hypothetical protein